MGDDVSGDGERGGSGPRFDALAGELEADFDHVDGLDAGGGGHAGEAAVDEGQGGAGVGVVEEGGGDGGGFRGRFREGRGCFVGGGFGGVYGFGHGGGGGGGGGVWGGEGGMVVRFGRGEGKRACREGNREETANDGFRCLRSLVSAA